MTRYFFDLSDGGWEPDGTGTDLPDDAVEREAIKFAGEVLRGEPNCLQGGSMRVNVHDQDHSIRFTIEISLVRDPPPRD